MWTSWGGTILPTTRRETEKEPPAFPKGQGRSHTALSTGWAHGSVSGVGTRCQDRPQFVVTAIMGGLRVLQLYH